MIFRLSLLFAMVMASTLSRAEPFPIETNDFQLWDSSGKNHLLSFYSDKPAIVFLAFPDRCDSKNEMFDWFSSLESRFLARNVAVFWLDASNEQNRQKVNAEVRSRFLSPVLMDSSQVESRHFGFLRAGDYVVIQPSTWEITKKGHWTDGGIEQLLQVPASKTSPKASDCRLVYRDRSHLIWNERMAKNFVNNCVYCHLHNQNVDMFNSDEDVFSWRAMNLLSIRMNKMPAGGYDPTLACGNPTLKGLVNYREVDELENWLDAGALHKKSKRDYVAELVKKEKQKIADSVKDLGEPSFKWQTGESVVPATGPDFFRLVQVAGPLKEDLAVKAFSDLHHSIARHHLEVLALPYPLSELKEVKENISTDAGMTGTVTTPFVKTAINDFVIRFRRGYVLFPKGSYVVLLSHFHPIGKEEKTSETIGVYTTSKKDGHEQKKDEMGLVFFKLNPGEKNRVIVKEKKLDKDIHLYYLNIHTHSRGKSFKLTAIAPDGRVQDLCGLGLYHIDAIPAFKDPIFLKKGTTLRISFSFDNSEQNPINPDSASEVEQGPFFENEMARVRFFYYDN